MAVERTKSSSSSLIDVLDHVLEKGVVVEVGDPLGDPVAVTRRVTVVPSPQTNPRRTRAVPEHPDVTPR